MRKWFKQICTALLCLTGCTPSPTTLQKSPEMENWAAYYATKLHADAFGGLGLVVFDGRHHPKLDDLKGKTEVLAYITMGEVYHDVPEKDVLARENSLLYHNDRWNSFVVDLNSLTWRNYVMASVDKAVADGFDGVMLDTVDSPLYWAEKTGPGQYKLMQKAALKMIHDIREKYPNIKIMLNRGFGILPYAVHDLDYILAESILTYKNEITGQYELLSPKAYSDAVAQLHGIVSRTNVKILTLDYWDMEDGNGLDNIYATQRSNGFVPYVTTPDLQHFTPEPVRKSSILGS